MRVLINGTKSSKMLTYWLLDGLNAEHNFTEVAVIFLPDDQLIKDWANSRNIKFNDVVLAPEILTRPNSLGFMKTICTLEQYKPDMIVLMSAPQPKYHHRTIIDNNRFIEDQANQRKIRLLKVDDKLEELKGR